MREIVIPVVIDPRNLRTFRQLDIALDELRRKAIDGAADATSPIRMTLKVDTQSIGRGV